MFGPNECAHMHAVSVESRRKDQFGVIDAFEPPCGWLGTEPRSSGRAFLTHRVVTPASIRD